MQCVQSWEFECEYHVGCQYRVGRQFSNFNDEVVCLGGYARGCCVTAPGRLPWARRAMRSRTRPLRLLLAALALASCAAAPAPEPRAQRSANLSHITGTSRKIQMVLKNHYLQLMPDGTVNGTIDGTSVYSEYLPNLSFLYTITYQDTNFTKKKECGLLFSK